MANIDLSHPAGSLPLARRLGYVAAHRWYVLFGLGFGVFVWLPFLAPVLMFLGWEGLGRGIYTLYSFLCHQLPERSYFFFGPQISYSIPEIQSAWQNTHNPLIFRQFMGSAEMGWKVAWSDRMVSMYLSIWVFGLLWPRLRAWLKPLPWWGLVLFLVPMAIDGTTHLFSDLTAPMGLGFRSTNDWLVALTGNAFAPAFYSGDAWGSFNAWLRLITGVFFGAGVVWFGFPYLHQAFQETAQSILRPVLSPSMQRLMRYNAPLSDESPPGSN